MTIEININKILDELNNESFTTKKGLKVVSFEYIKKLLIDLQLHVTIKEIIDNGGGISFLVPIELMDILKEDIGAYIHDYINQRISYRSIKEDELRYWRLRDKIKKALNQS